MPKLPESVVLSKLLGRWQYKGVFLNTEQLLRLSLAEARGEMRVIKEEGKNQCLDAQQKM